MCERGPGQCKASSAWSRTIAALQAEGPGGTQGDRVGRGDESQDHLAVESAREQDHLSICMCVCPYVFIFLCMLYLDLSVFLSGCLSIGLFVCLFE